MNWGFWFLRHGMKWYSSHSAKIFSSCKFFEKQYWVNKFKILIFEGWKKVIFQVSESLNKDFASWFFFEKQNWVNEFEILIFEGWKKVIFLVSESLLFLYVVTLVIEVSRYDLILTKAFMFLLLNEKLLWWSTDTCPTIGVGLYSPFRLCVRTMRMTHAAHMPERGSLTNNSSACM